MGVMFAVINAALLGLANFLLKKSFKDFAPSISFFILAIFSLLLWVPVGLIMGVQFDQWLFGSFVGISSAIMGQAIYIYVLQKGELSITATILASFSIYTIIFSMLFINERPSSLTLLFIIPTVLGTIVVSLPEKINKKELSRVSNIAWAVFAAICVGASDTLVKHYINNTSVGSFLFYVSFAQLVVSLIYLKLEKQPLRQLNKIITKFRDYKFALLGSLSIATATMFLFISFNFTLASIASPITASAPVVTVVLALAFLKEKITLKNWLGLLMVLVGIIGIAFVTA